MEINYNDLLINVDKMIDTLEYDSMRSPGKAKMNAGTLVDLYSLKDRYTSMKPTPVKKDK